MAGPYQLFLIRHGVAEERGDAWPDDTKRPLSEDGVSRAGQSQMDVTVYVSVSLSL